MAPEGSASTPEAKARVEIDRQLETAGWVLQHRDEMNLAANDAVAVREFKVHKGHGYVRPAVRAGADRECARRSSTADGGSTTQVSSFTDLARRKAGLRRSGLVHSASIALNAAEMG